MLHAQIQGADACDASTHSSCGTWDGLCGGTTVGLGKAGHRHMLGVGEVTNIPTRRRAYHPKPETAPRDANGQCLVKTSDATRLQASKNSQLLSCLKRWLPGGCARADASRTRCKCRFGARKYSLVMPCPNMSRLCHTCPRICLLLHCMRCLLATRGATSQFPAPLARKHMQVPI